MTVFANRLKALRKAKKLSQIEFGERVDATQAQISSYEVGRAHPTVQGLITIANVLDTTADYLLGITDNPTRDPSHVTQLNETQQELFDLIMNSDDEFQRKLLAAIKLFTE